MQRVIVTNSGPLHYLTLIGDIAVLPRLFGKVLVPNAVVAELSHANTPCAVKTFLSQSPKWLETVFLDPTVALPWPMLGDGERAAIAFAVRTGAALIPDGFEADSCEESKRFFFEKKN